MSKRFDKEVFIESVKSNLKTLYRQTLVDATKQQVFQAVSYAVKDTLISLPYVLPVAPLVVKSIPL